MANQVMIQDSTSGAWLAFEQPHEVLAAYRVEEVEPLLRRLDHLVQNRGLFAAGFISYEAAPAFDVALQVRPLTSFPLLWFGIYAERNVIRLPPVAPANSCALGQWMPSIGRVAYDAAIAKIKEHIADGETYQVNYTFRLGTSFSGDPWVFFRELTESQQSQYAAYVDIGRYVICSASPELFFRLDGRRLISSPMKGTAARGRSTVEDDVNVHRLRQSEKDRAENIMIVDMIRNDMGRVAETGSVRVDSLCEVERFPTVLQMISTVTAVSDATVCDIIAALFPCASVTGAPKPRTMHIIAGLETAPRRVYTGCIGFMAPCRQAQFNVAIRTVLIDRESGQAEYGVGGGIVWDSVSGEEYVECQIKAQVLTERRPEFSLLETMLWRPEDGYFLLGHHLKRLQDSAVYFGFSANLSAIQEKLDSLAHSFSPSPHRVRLLVSKDGNISLEKKLLSDASMPATTQIGLATTPVDSRDPFLYHKTTYRKVYDIARAGRSDCDDVLLWNERGEVTETSIANVVFEMDGELVTPPVSCGLLAGTFRQWLIETGKVGERVVTLDNLKNVRRTYTINSVRKWQPAYLKSME